MGRTVTSKCARNDARFSALGGRVCHGPVSLDGGRRRVAASASAGGGAFEAVGQRSQVGAGACLDDVGGDAGRRTPGRPSVRRTGRSPRRGRPLPPVTASTVYLTDLRLGSSDGASGSARKIGVDRAVACRTRRPTSSPEGMDDRRSSPSGPRAARRRETAKEASSWASATFAHLVGDDRLQVQGGHLLLAVGDFLERLEGRVQGAAPRLL